MTTITQITALAGMVSTAVAYGVGSWTTERRYKKLLQGVYTHAYEEAQKWVDVFNNDAREAREKYRALQQEIECHVHETHEEVERPHIPDNELTRWAEGYYSSEEYQQQLQAEKKGMGIMDAKWPVDRGSYSHLGYQEHVEEETFLDSVYGKADKK